MVSRLLLLVANRATRTLGYGFTTVLLGIYLKLLGGGDVAIVVSLGISLATGAALNVLVGLYGDRFGRRNAMALFGLLIAAAEAILALSPGLTIALVALALGSTSPTGTEVGPFLRARLRRSATGVQ